MQAWLCFGLFVLVKKFKSGIMKRLGFGALIRVWGISALVVTGLIVTTTTTNALGQDMQNMPGMNMPKSKSTASRKAAPRKRRVARKRQLTKKHDMSTMPGMDMPGMKMSATNRRRATSRRSKTPTGMGDDKSCTLACVKGGSKFVLADHEHKVVYRLDNTGQEKARDLPGKK